MPAKSYNGDTQTKQCPNCGSEQTLASEQFRAQCADVPTETDCCGAVVDWDDEPTVEFAPNDA